ncbi:MAG: hypothetical protein ACKON7_11925, partial [Planctomycetaceae bacterium]
MLQLHDPAAVVDSDGPRTAEAHAPTGLLARALVAWTRFCLRMPLVVIAAALLSAGAAGLVTARHLGYKVSRVDLLDPESDYNKLWIDYIREFGEDDDAVIVVEGSSREQVVAVLDELSAAVARDGDRFRSVLHEVDLSRIRAKGLHYLSPED